MIKIKLTMTDIHDITDHQTPSGSRLAGDDEPNVIEDKDRERSRSRSPDESQRPPDINPKGNRTQPATICNTNLTLNPDDEFPPINENIMKECEECHQDFLRSNLYRNFGVLICDDCRDPKGAHELITKTDVKNKYLLKDCDLDLRKPRLRYILKKNPYQSRGDMRLYLKYQIEERAVMVHGSEEQLEEEIEKREERRTTKKQKVFDKKMKSLSMQVRSSLYKRNVGAHEHDYGEPKCIDEDNDIFRKTCKTCGHKWEYEEM